MTKHRIDRGAYYVLPFAGPRASNLVRAVRPALPVDLGQWECRYVVTPPRGGFTTFCFLGSSQRVTPTEAARIIAAARKRAGKAR